MKNELLIGQTKFTQDIELRPGQTLMLRPRGLEAGSVRKEDVAKSFYLIGSLRNPKIPEFANQIVEAGFDVFADWFNPGPEADDFHRDYAKARGWSYREFLEGHAAKNIFEFDKFHMDRCDASVLLMPAGKSGHLELGYTIGRGKPGYLVFEEEPERYEIMVQFATKIFFSRQEFLNFLKEKKQCQSQT